MNTYREQFAFPLAPRGFFDEDFVYFFDSVNLLALTQPIPAGTAVRDIALRLHRDAPFIWRGTRVFTSEPGLGVQFRGPDGALLSDDYEPTAQSYFPGGRRIPGFGVVACEPGIECPIGSVIQLNLANLSAAGIVDPHTAVQLLGVKRWEVRA